MTCPHYTHCAYTHACSRRILALAKYGRLAALNDTRRADNFPLQELIERLTKITQSDVSLQELMKRLEDSESEVTEELQL
jgi:hypothetical protein